MFRKIHPSYLFLAFSASIIVGTICNLFLRFTFFQSFLWLILAIILFLVSLGFSRRVFFISIIISGFLLGAFRVNFTLANQNKITSYIGQNVELTGTAYEDLDVKNGTPTIRLNQIQIKGTGNDEIIAADIYATISGLPTDQNIIKRGDSVTLSGKLSEGFGAFSGSLYFAKVTNITAPALGDPARDFRDNFASKVETYIKSPESGLAFGYLLGQKTALAKDLLETFAVVGLTHMVVASGFHLSVLVGAVRRLFSNFSRFFVVLFGVALILFFAAVTGFGASMIRAGLVAILGLIFWYFGKKAHPINLLVFVAAFTLLLKPNYLFNIGWHLSFAAFAGVMLLTPLLIRYFYGKAKPNFIASLLLTTFSATLFTLPIILLFTERFSLASLPANLIIAPTIPAVMFLVAATGFFAFLFPPLASLFGFLSEKLLSFHIFIINALGELGFLHHELKISVPAVIIYYAILLTGIIYLKIKTKHRFREIDLLVFTPVENFPFPPAQFPTPPSPNPKALPS